jgi:hypothetical protein
MKQLTASTTFIKKNCGFTMKIFRFFLLGADLLAAALFAPSVHSGLAGPIAVVTEDDGLSVAVRNLMCDTVTCTAAAIRV